MTFIREDRYIVLKAKDLGGLSPYEIDWLKYLVKRVDQMREFRGKKDTLKCVVVENTWPEYELVWKMIEDRMNGNSRGTA